MTSAEAIEVIIENMLEHIEHDHGMACWLLPGDKPDRFYALWQIKEDPPRC